MLTMDYYDKTLHYAFWETASASTSENEEIEITVTIDGRVKTITEASIRRHLKLEDADGISSLPNTKIFEQLALMGVQLLGSDEGSLTLNELTVLYTTLSKKVKDLQNDLKQTKLTYGAAYTKLILRVKKLEHKVKASKSRRRARVIISDNEEDLEDSYKQGRIIAEIDQNPSISLPTELVEDFGSGEKGEKEISTANISVSTASAIPKVSTAGVSTTEAALGTVIPEVSTAAVNLVYIRRSAEKRKDKGKAIMKED
ncbi:hypothetical protein Tco_0758707 [Tanacetum coccineum]